MKTSKEIVEKLKANTSASIDESLASLLKDPLIIEKMDELNIDASIVSKNLPLFLDYQENINACNKCKGLDNCKSKISYCCSSIYVDEGGICSRRFGYCHYYLDVLKIKNCYLYRDFDENFLFSELKKSGKNAEDSKRLRDFSTYCINCFNDNNYPWGYIYGDVGVGKSSLLIATCNRIIKDTLSTIAFIDCNKRFDEFKNLLIKNKKEFEETLNKIAAVDILVLDNFGSEFKSEYVRDQILMPLLNYRAKKNKVTYFTSNYSLSTIQQLYSSLRSGNILAKQLVNLIKNKISKEYKLENGIENYLYNHK